MVDKETRNLVEAALFMSQNAIGVQEISKATGIASPGVIKSALEELKQDYSCRDTAIGMLEVYGKYMLTLKEPYSTKVSSLAIGPDLTRGALRLLAYLSKNDNALQSSLVKIFGSSTYEYVKELTEKEFIQTKKTGRSRRVSTTPKLKEYFNV